MKIYTKAGDKGETGLVGGKRVSKGELRIEAYGDVDELNAIIGIVCSFLENAEEDIFDVLIGIQEELFILGADLATPPDYHGKRTIPKITEAHVEAMESFIDQYEEKLPKLQNFILPSGSQAGSFLHLARTVCRRAERVTVRLSKEETVSEEAVKYLNRLSDFLFVLARTVNQSENAAEIPWIPDNQKQRACE